VALFSFFGKKDRQPDESVEDKESLIEEPAQLSPEDEDLAAWREAEQLRLQRDIARMTAEKIDAIESEIARDILKAPSLTSDTIPAEEPKMAPAPAAKTAADDAFQATIIRHDVNERSMLLEDSDE